MCAHRKSCLWAQQPQELDMAVRLPSTPSTSWPFGWQPNGQSKIFRPTGVEAGFPVDATIRSATTLATGLASHFAPTPTSDSGQQPPFFPLLRVRPPAVLARPCSHGVNGRTFLRVAAASWMADKGFNAPSNCAGRLAVILAHRPNDHTQPTASGLSRGRSSRPALRRAGQSTGSTV